jgi:hypothetical protein
MDKRRKKLTTDYLSKDWAKIEYINILILAVMLWDLGGEWGGIEAELLMIWPFKAIPEGISGYLLVRAGNYDSVAWARLS